MKVYGIISPGPIVGLLGGGFYGKENCEKFYACV